MLLKKKSLNYSDDCPLGVTTTGFGYKYSIASQ
jgi:hypothetical protein